MSTDTAAAPAPGPVDFLVIEFPGSRMTGEGLPLSWTSSSAGSSASSTWFREEARRRQRRQPRHRSARTGRRPGPSCLPGRHLGPAGARRPGEVADVLEAGSAAAVLVYENTWAAPLATALHATARGWWRRARIPAPALLEALDALDAAPSEQQSAGATAVGRPPPRAGRVDRCPDSSAGSLARP